MNAAVYVLIRTWNKATPLFPFESWFKRRACIKLLRIIGTYSKTQQNENRKALKGVVVGYDFCRCRGRKIILQNVIFNEKPFDL